MMMQLDQIIADALAGSPETHVAILAREVVRLREALAVVAPDDDRPSREFLENYVEGFDPGERSAALFGWREGCRHLREHSRAIPADEGMVAVDSLLYTALINLEKAVVREWGLCCTGDRLWNGQKAIADRRDALRTHQEGANHD